VEVAPGGEAAIEFNLVALSTEGDSCLSRVGPVKIIAKDTTVIETAIANAIVHLFLEKILIRDGLRRNESLIGGGVK